LVADFRHDLRRLNEFQVTEFLVISLIEAQPASFRASCTSVFNVLNIEVTPGAPPRAKLQRVGRPAATARAPSANA
jgi:hypothetical protein